LPNTITKSRPFVEIHRNYYFIHFSYSRREKVGEMTFFFVLIFDLRVVTDFCCNTSPPFSHRRPQRWSLRESAGDGDKGGWPPAQGRPPVQRTSYVPPAGKRPASKLVHGRTFRTLPSLGSITIRNRLYAECKCFVECFFRALSIEALC
jgi:hypothetical protein